MNHKLKQLRLEKGLTQEKLATILGISKGAISKWETGASFPDISLLPVIANFYGCTIDDLFESQEISQAAVNDSYKNWGKAFLKQGFYPTFCRIRTESLAYLNETKMLLSNCLVVINHLQIERQPEHVNEAVNWCRAYLDIVIEKTASAQETAKAAALKASCHLMLGEPQKVIAESEEDNQLLYMTQPILAQALMMSGEVDEAKLLLQKMAYQFMLNLYGNFEKLAVYEEDYQRFTYLKGITDSIIELFELRDFHPGVLLNGYADMALKFLEFKQADLALVELENYVSMIEQADYPIRLSGNHLFDLIDDWLQGLDEGKEMPVNEGVLANQLVALLKDPRLASDLAEETVYQQLITRLERWRATHVND